MKGMDWKRTVFVLIMPDALLRHLAIPILDRLATEGFVPFRYRLVQAGPEHLDALYKVNIDYVWDTYRYRLVDLNFRLGPCLAVLAHDQRTRSNRSHEWLQQIKGSNNPYEASKGTIRRDLRGINSILDLLHTSDSPEEAARDSAILFDQEASEDVTNSYEDDDPGGVWRLCRLLALQRPAERREFDDVLGGLRAKIATALWEEFLPEGRQMLSNSQAEGLAVFVKPSAGKALAERLRSGPYHPLAPVLECEFQPGHPRVNLERTWHLLAAYGVEVDPWERLVLTTSTYFKPCRRSDYLA